MIRCFWTGNVSNILTNRSSSSRSLWISWYMTGSAICLLCQRLWSETDQCSQSMRCEGFGFRRGGQQGRPDDGSSLFWPFDMYPEVVHKYLKFLDRHILVPCVRYLRQKMQHTVSFWPASFDACCTYLTWHTGTRNNEDVVAGMWKYDQFAAFPRCWCWRWCILTWCISRWCQCVCP